MTRPLGPDGSSGHAKPDLESDLPAEVVMGEISDPGEGLGAIGAPDLGHAVGRGAAWSLLNNLVGRLGNFLAGIVVIRILSEAEFGTYAVGMVVLAVLLSMNELGVSVAVVQRRGSVDEIAPTVMTLSILSSLVLAAAAFAAAPLISSALGTPAATWLIRLMVLGVLIDGIASVPNALITRALQQRKRLIIDMAAFVIGTPVTIILAVAGYGAWSLGWGAIVGNVVTGVLGFVWAPTRYWPGWRREVVRELLAFGLPLAGASLLLFLLLNVDYLVVGHVLGPVELGLYLLAFNLCSWPITVVSSAVRRISLPAFARMREAQADGGREGFAIVVGLTMAAVLPASAFLSLYAAPVIAFLYGDRWLPAAEPLRFLVVFSVGRVAVELTYDYLAANGRTRSTIWLHAVWLVALVPALIAGARIGGIAGVAIAHAAVVLIVLFPLLTALLRSSGIIIRRVIAHCTRPALGTAVMSVTVPVVMKIDGPPAVHVVVGGVAALLAYGLLVWPMGRVARSLWDMSASATEADALI